MCFCDFSHFFGKITKYFSIIFFKKDRLLAYLLSFSCYQEIGCNSLKKSS
nr:MAG TPA: hypothetical protein [Caudoviricetes sp.]